MCDLSERLKKINNYPEEGIRMRTENLRSRKDVLKIFVRKASNRLHLRLARGIK
jgi:hypothetical protein